MKQKIDSIIIFSGEGDTPASVRRGLGEAIKKVATQPFEIAISTLQENMCRFLKGLDAVISASPSTVGGLTLEEVEVHAQIDGKGNVGLAGIVGAEFAAQGGLKFVLRKKH